jgi:hypothetical protein
VKGSSRGVGLRVRVLMSFVTAFLCGAIAIFGMASLAGAALRVAGLSVASRVGIAAAGLLALGLVDLLAIKKRCYCPLGWRRQTPKHLAQRHAMTMVAGLWGFDAGLVVTTFRVAAVTWGALALALLGISSWRAGFAYGLGFVLPFLVVISTQAPAGAEAAVLEGMLRKRALAQSVSAVILFLAGATLLVPFLAS